MFVKVCGVRSADDVATAARAGADAVGIVFGESVRRVGVDVARALVAGAPDGLDVVGVFGGVPVADVERMAGESGVRTVQLHGDYAEADFRRLAARGHRLIRAGALRPGLDLTVGAFGEQILLLDGVAAGSGSRWDLDLLDQERPSGRWVLAGGLTPDNVGEAVARARPWGVDVSSGVEARRGVKDPDRITAFVASARAALAGVAG